MKRHSLTVLLIALQVCTVHASPDIEVRVSVSNATPMLDEPVEFTVQVRNIGDVDAAGVLIVDQLPVEMSIPAGTAAFPSVGSYDPASGEWFIGEVMTGETETLVIPAVVTSPQPPQCIINVADSQFSDLARANNEARAAIYQGTGYRCVDVAAFSNVHASIAPFPSCDAAESYGGSIGVRNFGPDAARDVVVSLVQTPIIGASIRFDDSRCVQSGLDVCTIAEIPGGQTWSLNVTSDPYQNYTDTEFQLALAVSTSDLEYAPQNDIGETEIMVRGFSSCQPVAPIITSDVSSGPCFIATAAYGSDWHPHLKSLRSFRDKFLLTHRPGRALVKFYYEHSPPLANFIAERAFLRAVTRGLLTPIVAIIEHPMAAALTFFALVATVVLRRRSKRFIAT